MAVDSQIYGTLNLPGPETGLATLGDLAQLKAVRQQSEAVAAKARAESEKAQREQQQAALIQSAVKKYQRPDGSMDRKGLVNEVMALDLEAGQKLVASFGKMDIDAANARKAQLDNEDATWASAARLLQGVTPQTYKPIWSRIRSIDPDLADILTPDYDPERVKGVVAGGTSRSEYNAEYKRILDSDENKTKKALGLLAIAKAPQHWQDALDFARLSGVDDELAAMGITPEFSPDSPSQIAAFLMGPEKVAELAGQQASREQQAAIADANRQTTERGQDISAATARRGQDITARGQDISAATARAGQAKAGEKGGPDVARIMGEIDTLSKRINTTGGGIGSVVGGLMRQGAAKAQYDNDVSEYEALVNGMIPMVARAVGHTGVLTQQDVDSVRALFPRVGENKTLAENKMRRVKGLIGNVTPAPSHTSPGTKLTAEELIKKYGGK